MSTDAPTPYELLRAVEQLRKDMRDGFGQMHKRLDGMATAEVLELTRRGFDHRIGEAEKDIADLAAKRESDAKEREKDKRQRIALVVMASIAIVMPIVNIVVDLSRAVS